jgi:hypothetical protein
MEVLLQEPPGIWYKRLQAIDLRSPETSYGSAPFFGSVLDVERD